MSIYPPKIDEVCRRPLQAVELGDPSSIGRGAAFECGTVIEIRLQIEPTSKSIQSISYHTNGCGFMIAAAKVLSIKFQGKKLTELQGANEITELIFQLYDGFPNGRSHCVSVVVEAFRNALAEYRTKCVEEFRGEKALICTCFGIDEESIVSIIATDNVSDVSEVTAACNAGRGCGSCRMLIQELIDSAHRENL